MTNTAQTAHTAHYLPEGLPIPVSEADGLSAPYWSGLQQGRLMLQRCQGCGKFQWGPEWICHRCHSFSLAWEQVEPIGRIYSWSRVWHPVHPALNGRGAYLVVVVELPQADGVRLIGNLVGDAQQPVRIGDVVHGVFEQHPDASPPHVLLHWRAAA